MLKKERLQCTLMSCLGKTFNELYNTNDKHHLAYNNSTRKYLTHLKMQITEKSIIHLIIALTSSKLSIKRLALCFSYMVEKRISKIIF